MIPSRINPIDHPICLAAPERLAPSHWDEHVPFAMWLTSVLKPRVLVELGTYGGTSYCAFCQAIKTLGLTTRAYAVDSWNGDPHNGSYGPEVLADLRDHHDPRYASFSSLLEMTFDAAARRFADDEIDLLHIDGYHEYEAVRHDFETWRDKLSDRGVILFHDVCERFADFGVFQLWDELIQLYPSFTFLHEHGLGVLVVGREVPPEIRALTSLGSEEAERVRMLFRELGRRTRLDAELNSARAEGDSICQSLRKLESDRFEREALLEQLQKELEQERTIITGLYDEVALLGQLRKELEQERTTVIGLYDEVARLEDTKAAAHVRLVNELELERARIRHYESETAKLQASRIWRLVQLLTGLRRLVSPGGLRRRLAQFRTRPPAVAPVSHEPAQRTDEPVDSERRSADPHDGTGSARPSAKPAEKPVFLLVSHQGGGGTERHVRELAAALRLEGIRSILVRPSGTGKLLWEERDEFWQVSWSHVMPPEREPIHHLLSLLSPLHAHIHHVLGLPDAFPDWLTEAGVSYDWTIHDYYSICPRAHLNRANGTYCGEPEADDCDRCLSRLGDYNGSPVPESITSWRDRSARYLRNARRIFAPSEDVRRRLRQYFPDLPVLHRPHFERLPDLSTVAAPLRPGDVVRVAVLGAIVPIKGSERLLACARDARRRDLPLEFRILGSTDRDDTFARLGNVHVCGAYREREVFHRLRNERCHIAFLPSLWPETFMYTLSIAMTGRLFIVAFDLGAQAERLRTWQWSKLLPLEASPDQINDALLSAASFLCDGSRPPKPAPSPTYPELLISYYDFTERERARLRGSPPREGSRPRSTLNGDRNRAHALTH